MQKKNFCVVTFPISAAGVIPLSNLLDIFYPLSHHLSLITGNEGYHSFKDNSLITCYGIYHETGKSIISRIKNYILTQLHISYQVLKVRHSVDTYILFIGGQGLILPMISIKLLGKTAILAPVDYTVRFSNDLFSRFLIKITSLNCILCDKIILHSPLLIKEWGLENYSSKIVIAHEYFLDFSKFKLIKKFDSRLNLIGYVGRLDREKGVLNFVESIPKILHYKNDFKFLIAGDGPLFGKIENYLALHDLKDKVQLLGWVPHDKLPEHLNELKLLIIPSYTESGPIIALESMTCGTPIVATKVGQILNMISDEENGFIMENNSSDCISKNILRALDSPNINQIILNAQDFVKNEFTYDAAIKKYKKIFDLEGF